MKLKGISKFEQHVEKYVLAGAAAALTGVVVWQLISPSKVKVGTNELSYSEMYEPLRVTAQQTKSRVEDPNPKLPEAPKVKLADAFQAQLQGKVVPREQLVAMGVPVTLDKGKSEPVSDSTFAIVVAPAPSEVHAHAFWSTVDPIEAASSADVAAVLPKTQPFDKSAVSVQIAFSGVDFRTALDTDPDGPEQPIQPVRRAWYRDLEIIGVELEREEEQPDGTFGNPVIVSSMPGRVSGLKIFTETVKAAADVPSALAAIHAAGSEAVRPSYYDTLDGTPTWTEPNMVTESGEDQAAKDLKSLMAARQEAQKTLDSINARLKAANAPQQGGNRENRGAGGGKSGGGMVASPGKDDPTKKDATTERLIRNAKAAQERLDKNRRELESLGFDIEGNPLPKSATVSKTEPPMLENKALNAWAHDVTVTPGAVYHYRARVLYNNPYFGQGAFLKQEQKALAADPVGRGEWSAWTADVAVDRQENFFITGATADPLKGPRATAELYKFYYGYPRRVQVSVETGDMLAGHARLPEGLLIYDIKKLEAARAKPAAAAPGQPPRDDRSGGKGGGLVAPPEPSKEETEKKDKEELLGTPIERELVIGVNAMMLDAANAVTPGSSERSFAFLKLENDQIVTRVPELERQTALYRRLLAQSRQGDAQGKPKAVAQPKKSTRQQDQLPTPPRPPSGPGGGGGGGG